VLIDSHCHLDFPEFAADLDGVVARARAAGVGGMVTISTHLDRAPSLGAIAERFAGVWCTVGVHPHEAASHGAVTDLSLREAAQGIPRVIGLGETGLDFHYEHSPRTDQERLFRAHISAARDMDLPVIVHTRGADAETIAILADELANGAFRGLIHCFSTSRELAEKAIELGFYVSVAGIVTFRKAEELRAIVADLPLERLLVETDAPYLAPMPNRGKRNEPSFLTHTAAQIAELKGVSAEELGRSTTDNFFRLFRRANRAELAAA
jgi:TatD DNase family protein